MVQAHHKKQNSMAFVHMNMREDMDESIGSHHRQKSMKHNNPSALMRNLGAVNTGPAEVGPQSKTTGVNSPSQQVYHQAIYGSGTQAKLNANKKSTPKQFKQPYGTKLLERSDNSMNKLKYPEQQQNMGNIPSSFQSSFSGLPKVQHQINGQVQNASTLAHQQEILRQHIYGSGVTQSVDASGKSSQLPSAKKVQKQRIKSSGKLSHQLNSQDDNQYTNLPTNSQQSQQSFMVDRQALNTAAANHNRIQSIPTIMQDRADKHSALANQYNDPKKNSMTSFQSSQQALTKQSVNKKHGMQRVNQIQETHQQPITGHAKYMGQQAQTVQQNTLVNSLAQSTTGINTAFSKALNTLGNTEYNISRQEAVNHHQKMIGGPIPVAVKGKTQGQQTQQKIQQFNLKLKSFGDQPSQPHHQKALSMSSYMMQPKQLSNTQQQAKRQIGMAPNTAGTHQSAGQNAKKQQLSFASDPHVVNTMQHRDVFSHSNLPMADGLLTGSKSSHQNSLNAIVGMSSKHVKVSKQQVAPQQKKKALVMNTGKVSKGKTSPRTTNALKMQQSISPQISAKQSYERRTDTANMSNKAALLQQQFNQQQNHMGHKRQGTIEYYQKKMPGQQKVGGGPIAAAAGDTSTIPASNVTSSNHIAINQSQMNQNSQHRRTKSDAVEMQQNLGQSGQIVVINNNNTFEFQMHGTNINIHPGLSVEEMQRLSSSQISQLQQIEKANSHYFKVGNSDMQLQQQRKNIQKQKYDKMHNNQAMKMNQVTQSIDVKQRSTAGKQVLSGRPPSSSAHSIERARFEQSHPVSNENSVTRSKKDRIMSSKRSGGTSKNKNQRTVTAATVGASKKPTHQKAVSHAEGFFQQQRPNIQGGTHKRQATMIGGLQKNIPYEVRGQPVQSTGDKQPMIMTSTERSSIPQDSMPASHEQSLMSHQESKSYPQKNQYGSNTEASVQHVNFKQMSASNLKSQSEHGDQFNQYQNFVASKEPHSTQISQKTVQGQIQFNRPPPNVVMQQQKQLAGPTIKHKKVASVGQQQKLYQILSNPALPVEQKQLAIAQINQQNKSKTPDKMIMSAQVIKQKNSLNQEPYVQTVKQAPTPPKQLEQNNYNQKMQAKNRQVQSDLQRKGAGSQLSQMSQKKDEKQKKPEDSKLWSLNDPNNPMTPKKLIINQILVNISKQIYETKIDYYKIGKVIGKGAFGKVNLAIHRLTGRFVALKSINKTFMQDENSLKKVMQEYNILKRARHKNIVRLYESFETDAHIVYVMEVCGGGDLLTYVRRRRKLKEDLAKFVFRQLIHGIYYVNSKRVLHRDIKLDNILLTSEGDVKICDFGVSKVVQSATAVQTEQCGTPAYIAPEVFRGRGYKGFQSDIWSAGVVLYAMLYGTVPFKATNMAELQKQILKVDCSWGSPGEISAQALTFLKKILEVDPTKRLTPQQILADPWMHQTEDQARQVEVFTQYEKEKIIMEFQYYNTKKEQENGKTEDPFLEQMLQTTQNSVMKNNTTKSVILAPFNSTKSNISDNFYKDKSIQDLLVSNEALVFEDRCKEVNRQYMLNNNAELDNGVYNEQEKKEDEEDKQPKKDDGLKGLDEQIQQAPALDAPILDSAAQSQLQSLNTSQVMVDSERVDKMTEQFGYDFDYVIDNLESDNLNHATTTYFLMDTEKEF